MIVNRRHVIAGLAVSIVAASGKSFADSYPSRPVRIVTSGAGSDVDYIARVIAQGIAPGMGQPVIVENRDGSVTPGLAVAEAAPDGYTLLVSGGALWETPLLQKVPYALKDFAPITLVTRSPKVLVVNPSLPVHSVADLIAYAKAKPGVLNYASSGVGTPSHLAVALFGEMTGTRMIHVPFKQNAALMASLLGGETQLAILSSGGAMADVAAGRLRGLAVTSLESSALVPGLPTIASTVPGYESQTVYGIFAPAKTPTPIVQRVHDVVAEFLDQPDTKKTILAHNNEAVSDTPAEFAAYIKTETTSLGKVVKDLGLSANSAG